ncbi:B-cell differentiation antigen CD72 [Balaenoptera ricei]|uniref:B-cell differentiation antigen CD72 n=1 Tax=Balaenoptera ricei TaxID=2746895 RepID=UPI0028BEDC88|nr:B-cell differentiation antigen CD72 [Balaenoptera ricei]
MAEAITYADLRFVKAPLRKSVSSRLGQDPEADEDGELTYENIQVPPGPGGPSSLASTRLGDKTGVQSEQPTAAWSPVTSPAAGRILPCHASYMQYLLLGLLLACLLLGVAATCLGVHYFQVSQQLQQTNRVLEATNSTLRQQLRLKITQLGQREEDLQGSRRELAQSQETLQVEQKVGQATKEQLQACQSDGEKTKEALRNKEIQRTNLEQELSSVRDTLKPFFTCTSPDSCCPLGWILNERSCFYISVTKRSWEESQNHCKSLSSELAKIGDISYAYGTHYARSLRKVLAQGGSAESYWIDFRNKFWQWSDGTRYNGFYGQSQKCAKVEGDWLVSLKAEDCYSSLPSICEMEAFRYPDVDHSLH